MANIYSRTNVFKFLEISLRTNKNSSDYFNLVSQNVLFIELNNLDWKVYVYLLRNMSYINKNSRDILLYVWKVRDLSSISNFCTNLDLLIQTRWLNLRPNTFSSLITKEHSFENLNNYDFDNI